MSAINYQKVDWKDAPTYETPVNATNLKKMDDGIYDLDQIVGAVSAAAGVEGDTVFEKINKAYTDSAKKWSGTNGGNTYVTVDAIAYDSVHKKLGLKVNGADTVIPFSSGAVYVGRYTANASINVSSLGATSASQFLVVPESDLVQYGYEWRDYWDPHYRGKYVAPTVSLSGSTLSVVAPQLGTSCGMGSYNDGYTWKAMPYNVYFVGDIQSMS